MCGRQHPSHITNHKSQITNHKPWIGKMTTTTRLQLHLHTLIDTSQKQHGILQNNYTNYRQACTRKLDRLRHGKEYRRLLIQHAKAAATEVEKEEEQKESICKPVEHINTLMICLFQAERAWSYSMELKAEYDAKTVGTTVAFSDGFKKNSSAGNVRNHFLRRLRKAVKYAEELEYLCKALADDVSIAEASIYCCWMRAGLALEVKNWRTACKDYGKALAICRTFASSEGTLSAFELDLFESRAEFIIEPVLKYCQYELKDGGSNENELEQQLIDQQNRANEELYPILNAKINVENGQSEESNRDVGINSIEFRGRTLPVSNASLRNALCKINEAVESISNATNPDEDQFETLFDVHNSAIQIIENDIQKLDNMNKAAQVGSRKQEQESLLAYVQNSKLTHALQKGEAEALKLRESSCSINDDDQIKYFEDLSHIYDSLVRQAKEKSELPGGDDDEFAAAADAHVLRLDAQRCYYIGNIYAAKGKVSLLFVLKIIVFCLRRLIHIFCSLLKLEKFLITR